MRTKILIACVFGACVPDVHGAENGGLTIDEAGARALARNPVLTAAAEEVAAADARAHQAGLWPNPEIELEVENFGGSDELSGFDGAESTAVLTQPLPLGGKPGRRRAVAESEIRLARLDLESVRLDTVAKATSAFYGVLAAQQRRDLAVRLLEISEDFARVVGARVDAGKVSPVEATRADIEVAQGRIGLARANRALNAAQVELAATWGTTSVDFERADGTLPVPTMPPTIDRLRSMMEDVPELRRLEEEIERQQRAIAFEKALGIPDLAIGAGPRRYRDTGQSAWVAGVTVSIPVFDRNQGARKAAEFDLERVRHESEAHRVHLEAELRVLAERLQAAAEASLSAQSEVMPAATGALTAVETGYREGKFGFIDVIAAQRTFFEASSLLLDSLEEYALTRTELERLLGRGLVRSGHASVQSENQGEMQ